MQNCISLWSTRGHILEKSTSLLTYLKRLNNCIQLTQKLQLNITIYLQLRLHQLLAVWLHSGEFFLRSCQQFKIFLKFRGLRRFITLFTWPIYWSPSRARLIQFIKCYLSHIYGYLLSCVHYEIFPTSYYFSLLLSKYFNQQFVFKYLKFFP